MLSAHREAGKSTSEYAVAAGGSLRAQPARATAERAATTYVYARHAPAADARGAWRCWGRLARRECGGASPGRAGNRKKETHAEPQSEQHDLTEGDFHLIFSACRRRRGCCPPPTAATRVAPPQACVHCSSWSLLGQTAPAGSLLLRLMAKGGSHARVLKAGPRSGAVGLE